MKIKLGAIIAMSFGSTILSYGQDFERFAPKEIETKKKAIKLDVNENLPDLSKDKTQILPKLKGLVLRLKPSDVKDGLVKAHGVVIANDSVMTQPEFKKMMKAYIGKPVSMVSLDMMTREIVLYYRKQGVPVVDVILPEQDITNAVIQVVVLEGKLGKVSVSGNKHFKASRIANQIRLQPGDRIEASPLLADIDWINENPFLNVSPIFSPGKEPYTTDLILKAEDTVPWRAYLGYEDSGNDLTGEDRYLLGLNWGNAFNVGHQLNYQLTMAGNYQQLNAHSLSYIIPLEWRHKLSFSMNYTDTSVKTGPFTIDGESAEIGMRYNVPLEGSDRLTHSLYTGIDWKKSKNALEFGLVPASGATTEVGQFVIGYKREYRDDHGYTGLDASLVYSPGGIFSGSNDTDYNSSRAGAESSYKYFKLRANRINKLPMGMSLDSELTFQWSGDRLLSSEQLSAGGYASVRGYDEREFNFTDSGFISRNELRFPSFSTGISKELKDEWQFLIFSDFAWVRSHQGQVLRANGTSADNGYMWSVGPGLRLKVGEHFTMRADYGIQLKDAGSSSSNGRFHIGGVLTF